MKKIISIIMVLVFASAWLSSCKKNDDVKIENTGETSYLETEDLPPSEYALKEKYDVMYATEYYAMDLLSGMNPKRDIWVSDYNPDNEDDAPEKIQYPYGDYTYPLEHMITYNNGLLNGFERQYTYAGVRGDKTAGRLDLSFGKDGSIVEFRMDYSDSKRPKPYGERELSITECEVVAKKRLEDFVDADKYTKISEIYLDFMKCYSFTWMRKIGNLDTMDKISMSIDIYGNVVGYSILHAGDMNHPPEVSEEIIEMAKKASFDDIREKFDAVKDRVSYEIKESEAEVMLVRIFDGRVSLVIDFGVFVTERSTGRTMTEPQTYVVPIE